MTDQETVTNMRLKPSPKVVERTVAALRRRIRDDREYLAQNEMQTRVLLIDPLLRALGWDPGNSMDVRLEFRTGKGRVDYALMREGAPVIVIEAKKLEHEIGREVRQKLFEYADAPRCLEVRLAVATDGDAWFFWRKSDGWSNRWDAKVKISSRSTLKAASALVEYLSPSKLRVRAAKKPIRTKSRKTRSRRGKWYPLVGELPEGRPTAVRLGDEPQTNWVSWRELYADVAEYLYATGYLDESDLPVYVANGRYCAINDVGVHPGPDRKPFGAPVQIGENMWLETDVYSKSLRDYPRRLLTRFHNNPGSVQLRYD